MTVRAAVVTMPFGPVTVIADGDTVLASGFTSTPETLRRHLPDRRLHVPVVADLGLISERLRAYSDGEVTAIDGIAVSAQGSETMQRLWTRLRAVAAGTTVSYAELGGAPRMAKVAATACARNPVCLIVPCHRVIRGDGGLGGFGGGLPAKRWLLDHEAATVGCSPLLAVS